MAVPLCEARPLTPLASTFHVKRAYKCSFLGLTYEGGTEKAPVEVPTPTTAFYTAATTADRSSPLI